MKTAFEKRPVERFQYWHGQMLRSADFRAQRADTAQHRWWHNRALHNAYGVYQGLNASPVVTGGALTGVRVIAGIAYDCFGRELVVDNPQTIALPINVPPPPVTMVLLIRYTEECDCQPRDTDEICWTTSGPQSASAVSFIWMPLTRVQLRDGVPLGQVTYDNTGKRTLEPKFVPPGSRPVARPGIASGATLPATTAWEPWSMETHPDPNNVVFGSQSVIGVQAAVDTSAAGFTRTPCYFAWLAGPLFNSNTGQLLPDMFPSLTNESATGFTFRMWFPPAKQPEITLARRVRRAAISQPDFTIIRSAPDFFPFARQQKLYVLWMACQMPPTLPFVPLRLRILNELLLPLVLQKVELVRNLIK